MTKAELIELVKTEKDNQEQHYISCGPDKHDQEEHYVNGISVIQMNVNLLEGWLEDAADGALDCWQGLSEADKREVWEASEFHFGIYGYDEDDADHFWHSAAVTFIRFYPDGAFVFMGSPLDAYRSLGRKPDATVSDLESAVSSMEVAYGTTSAMPGSTLNVSVFV